MAGQPDILGAHAAPAEKTDSPPAGLGRVRDFLIARPEVIRNDPGLLKALGLRQIADNVVDFGPAAMARLEKTAHEETSARHELEAVARANYEAQAQTRDVVLELLEARNAADLARRLADTAAHLFDLDAAALLLEGPAAPSGWRTLPYGDIDGGLGLGVDRRLGPIEEAEEIFGPEGEGVVSAALVRLSLYGGRPGLLAFGSKTPDAFHPHMGAELLLFIARVVERIAGRWPPVL
jgi:uncharacterized protein YigA (DUF484 family)